LRWTIIRKRYYGRFCFEGTSDPPDADAGKKHGGENIVKNKSRIGFVVDYIKKNLHQKLSIDSIAKMAYVGKSNFFKMFKDELGTSPNEFILQERINRAKELLASQNSIKETAYQTGFSDANYFTRVFKQLVGVTPKSYQDKVLFPE
jgi:AraC-like DNA-binding protein